jgi:hypothetical protein
VIVAEMPFIFQILWHLFVIGFLFKDGIKAIASAGDNNIYEPTQCPVPLFIILPFRRRKLFLPCYEIGHVKNTEMFSLVCLFPIAIELFPLVYCRNIAGSDGDVRLKVSSAIVAVKGEHCHEAIVSMKIELPVLAVDSSPSRAYSRRGDEFGVRPWVSSRVATSAG